MTKTKLPQPVAIRIEIARAGGLSDEALIQWIDRGDTAALQPLGPEWLTWDILTEYAEQHGDDLRKAIREGYEFKFLTIRGLIHYLLYRFGLREQADYRLNGSVLEGVALPREDVRRLRETIPAYWDIVETESVPGAAAEADLDVSRERITFRIERLYSDTVRFEGGETG